MITLAYHKDILVNITDLDDSEARIAVDSAVDNIHKQRMEADLCGVDGYEVLSRPQIEGRIFARVAITYDLPEENLSEVLRP